jgi:hypothetical protein
MLVRMTRNLKLAAGILAAVVIGVGVLARSAGAFNPQPDPPFAMVGIAQGQTARLNLVNTGSPAALPPPCRARLRFLDADGNVLANLRAEAVADHATFLDYTASFAPNNTVGDTVAPARAEIRAAVHFIDDQIPPPCRVNVEIFDNTTGRTSIQLPPGPCRGAACEVKQ